jgi:hypothetical protein
MSVVSQVDLAHCSPSQLWASLDSDERVLAARSLYAHDWGDNPARREADAAIMFGMRFRESAVRQLPHERRAAYLAKSVRPNDALAGSLLLAIHLENRRSMLAAFLDALGVPHVDGLIAEDYEPKAPTEKALSKAADALFAAFPARDVEIYLASLYVLDRVTWAGLEPVLAARE